MSYDAAVTLNEFWVIAKQFDRSLYREWKDHWDSREFDEYIVAAEGLLPCQYTPEDLACQQETLDEILAVLALCTDTQRERFLLHTLYDLSHAEVAKLCGCSKEAVRLSIEAVRKKFLKFFQKTT